MKNLIIYMAVLTLYSCSLLPKDDDAVLDVATQWADAYFNCDLTAAQVLSTEESERWLRFAASNISEAHLQLLRDHSARVEGCEYYTIANDTLCVVALRVSHYLVPVMPGDAPRQSDSGTFQLTLVKRNEEWKVRMEGLPRSERQNRD